PRPDGQPHPADGPVHRRGGRRRAVAGRRRRGRGRAAGHRPRRPQPGDQPAVRVHRPRHVPRPGARRPPAVRRDRGREGTAMTTPATTPHAVPLSVLDLALVPEGGTGAEALRDAVDLAVDLDELGYRRVWYAEHHLAPGVASAAPAVLASAVAARTSRIRVGSGAVLLSTTSPL